MFDPEMPDWMRPVDQYQEAMDYEANAEYDRWEGWGDPDPNDGWNDPDDRTAEQRAADEKFIAEFNAQVLAEAEARHAMDALFGPVYVPF